MLLLLLLRRTQVQSSNLRSSHRSFTPSACSYFTLLTEQNFALSLWRCSSPYLHTAAYTGSGHCKSPIAIKLKFLRKLQTSAVSCYTPVEINLKAGQIYRRLFVHSVWNPVLCRCCQCHLTSSCAKWLCGITRGFAYSRLSSQHSHDIRLSWPPLAWGLPFHPLAWGLWSNKLDKCWQIHLPVKLRVTHSQSLQRLIGTLYYRRLSRCVIAILFWKRKSTKSRVLSGGITFLPHRLPVEQFVQTMK